MTVFFLMASSRFITFSFSVVVKHKNVSLRLENTDDIENIDACVRVHTHLSFALG